MGLLNKFLERKTEKKALHPNFWDAGYNRIAFDGGISLHQERLPHDFNQYVDQLYKSNSVVYACIQTRFLILSEARFQWQRIQGGRPDELFGSRELSILETPWPGASTANLIQECEVDGSLAGNSYWTFADDNGNIGKAASGPTKRIARLRPDWVDIIVHSPSGNPFGADVRVGGYLYRPRLNNVAQAEDAMILLMPDEVAHYKAAPDPVARFRGMSWLTPALTDIMSDNDATTHKRKFLQNGATLGHVMKFSEEVSTDDFEYFVEKFKQQNEGVENAYKTLFLGGGADVTPLSVDFKQLEFSQTQGAGETRIAADSGVAPIIVGLSEGLQSATYSNYGQARRRVADGTFRPIWHNMARSFETLVDKPTNTETSSIRLWTDERDVAFLREDRRDVAEIQSTQATAIQALTEAGYETDSVIQAIDFEDMSLLEHTGYHSVQLQAPIDPADPLEPQKANVFNTQASAVQTLVNAGFTHDSAVEAVDNGDMTLLEMDEEKRESLRAANEEEEEGEEDGEEEPPGGGTLPSDDGGPEPNPPGNDDGARNPGDEPN